MSSREIWAPDERECEILVLDEHVIESGVCWHRSSGDGRSGVNAIDEVVFRFRGREFRAWERNACGYSRQLEQCASEMLEAGLVPAVAGLSPDYSESGLSAPDGRGYLGDRTPVDLLDPAPYWSTSLPVFMQRHPRVFSSRHLRGVSDLPAGWTRILDRLCRDIASLLEAHPDAQLRVNQIKSKFGSLRFRYELEAVDGADNNGLPAASGTNLRDQIQASLERVYVESTVTCEVCGAAAITPEGDPSGPRCAIHLKRGIPAAPSHSVQGNE